MKSSPKILAAAILLMSLAVGPSLFGQAKEAADLESLKKSAPKIYIDCGFCDLEYIKTEITFVNYVRDRNEAEVHVLITTQSTAGGGQEYTIAFSGQIGFSGLDDTVTYFSNRTDTEDEIRRGLVKTLKMGLMSYVARRPIASRIEVSFAGEPQAAAAVDKWKSWVFNVGGNGHFNGEQSISSHSFGFNFSANKITSEIKLQLGLSASFQRNSYTYEDQDYTSTQESYAANGLFVKSLGEHWSAGFALDAYSSTYENTALRVAPAPAVEFNVFPYSQSTRRQLRIRYKLPLSFVRYREETIYGKRRETLLQQSLSVTLDIKEKWGSISATLSGAHYFHDLARNDIGLFASVQLNLFKGLNAFVFGGGSRIHDQLALVKGTASLEEILLQRRQLETTYNYFAMVGLSYTFGSIYTNVVNPRFGSTSSGGIQININ
jgi:hypothetical protein